MERFDVRLGRGMRPRALALVLVASSFTATAPGLAQAPAPASLPPFPAGWPFPPAAEPVVAPHGMVASDAPLATAAGVRILAQGGNAVDAAVATAFALAVVLPAAGNLGGGGFIVAHLSGGRNVALDFREMAPRAASRDMYLDSAGNVTDRGVTGHLAAGVPGSVAGLWEAHRRYGRKSWRAVLAPAIRLADEGFIIEPDFARGLRSDSARLSRFAASRALFLPDSHPLPRGRYWRNPELAATLRRIAAQGPAGFYRGRTADLIVAEMRRGGGIITRGDLLRYRARWRTPIVFPYRGQTVVTMPPASSGGITIALMANLLRAHPLHDAPWGSADRIHLLAEASRRAFAVRNHFLGDPGFVDIPVARLLSRSFADSLGRSFAMDRATPSRDIAPATGSDEGRHTTHLSVADRWGNAVALTTTINVGFGSAVVVAGAGFLLNDEMDDFTSKIGARNAMGLEQGAANAIAPGKRMLSSMTPTIVLDSSGAVRLVTGASGGATIISTVFQILTNVVDYDFDITAAVGAPRIHMQHIPDSLFFDTGGLPPALLDSLARRGHTLVAWPVGGIGIGASILRRGGQWRGTHDPRTRGLAAGY